MYVEWTFIRDYRDRHGQNERTYLQLRAKNIKQILHIPVGYFSFLYNIPLVYTHVMTNVQILHTLEERYSFSVKRITRTHIITGGYTRKKKVQHLGLCIVNEF